MPDFQRPDLKAAASPALMARGCVNVIGLEALRERAGSRWEKIRDGVHARLEQILRQRLGPADFFVPLDEVSYLVTMPAADAEDAQVACLGAAHDLHVGYLGRCDADSVSLYCARPGEGDAIVLERLPPDRLRALAARADADGPKARRGVPGGRNAQESAAACDVHFVPVWDARKEAITLYLCVPRKFPGGLGVGPAPGANMPTAARVRMELACVQQGAAILAAHLERGERFLMGFALSYETLGTHAARVAFVTLCRELPSEFRQYFVFVLTDVPLGAPQSRLSELVMAIRPYARAVMAETPPHCRSHGDYRGIGLQALGLNLEGGSLARKAAPNEIMRLSAAAKRLSLSTFLTGVADAAALEIARQENIQFMAGCAIAPVLKQPRPMTRLLWPEVMAAASR